jgi:hypothetical protein
MKSERKKHFAVDKLSPQAKRLVDDGLAANATYDEIIKTVRAIGETLALSSLSRYREKQWFPTRATLEETNRFYGLIKESLEKSQGKKLDEVSSELLKHHLFKAMAAIKDGDPVKLYDLVISEGRLGVEKEKVELAKQKLATEKERLDILREQVGDHGDKATLFIEFMKAFAGYLGKKDQEALKYLQPHIRGFAAEVKQS